MSETHPWHVAARRSFRRCTWKVRRQVRRLTEGPLLVKILAVLVLGVAPVVGAHTHLIRRLQERWENEHFDAAYAITTLLVQEQITRCMLAKSSRSHPLPRVLAREPNGPAVWLVDDNQKVLFSTDGVSIGRVWEPGMAGYKKVTTAYLPNRRECKSCHQDQRPYRARILIAPQGLESSGNWQTHPYHQWMLLCELAITALILFGVVFSLRWFVNRPLARLEQLMRQVQAGDLSVKFKARGDNEIARLARGFNQMTQSLVQARASLQNVHERQIQQAEKLASVGELASGLAHEIRNPLAGIKTAVQVLSEKISAHDGKDDDLEEVVHEVSAQTERVHRLVDDLLRYARPKLPQTMPCDMQELVEKSLTLVRPQAEKQGVSIEFTSRVPDDRVSADPEQIQQAVLNVILNAIQAMPGGGFLRLAMTKDKDLGPGFLLLRVQDTGPGMTAEVQQRIFSPFFTTKPQGTGLGLSITRGIIERHQGALDFQSKRGEGTTFTIRLPLLKSHGCCTEQECPLRTTGKPDAPKNPSAVVPDHAPGT